LFWRVLTWETEANFLKPIKPLSNKPVQSEDISTSVLTENSGTRQYRRLRPPTQMPCNGLIHHPRNHTLIFTPV
jgi:hypothetical protein